MRSINLYPWPKALKSKNSEKSALSCLQNLLGYEQFRGHQQAIIERVIDGEDTLVLMPTGGGKSLC